jgi:hypothetical protein
MENVCAGLSIVSTQVRELVSSSFVVSKLRLKKLRQLREIILRYIRTDVLPESVAVGNVSASEQPVEPVFWLTKHDCKSCYGGIGLYHRLGSGVVM